jgi:hypothetical protein
MLTPFRIFFNTKLGQFTYWNGRIAGGACRNNAAQAEPVLNGGTPTGWGDPVGVGGPRRGGILQRELESDQEVGHDFGLADGFVRVPVAEFAVVVFVVVVGIDVVAPGTVGSIVAV